MSKFISAIHKIVIKDVDKFTDKRIETTKHVINNK